MRGLCGEPVLRAQHFIHMTSSNPKNDPTRGPCHFIESQDPDPCLPGRVGVWPCPGSQREGRCTPTWPCPAGGWGEPSLEPGDTPSNAGSHFSKFNVSAGLDSFFQIPEVIRPDGRAACQLPSLPHSFSVKNQGRFQLNENKKCIQNPYMNAVCIWDFF